MATVHKTVHVKDIIAEVNRRNMCSTCEPKIREGWNILLEHILHEAEAYAGFNNLTEKQVPEGHKPGIIFDPSPAAKHEYPDDSRRFYYTHRKL